MASTAESATTIGDGVWIATALLHREHPERADFTVREIRERLGREGIAGPVRPSFETHIRQTCVANARRDPSRLRMLFATGTRTRRLFRPGDPYDPSREGGRIVPAADAIPARYGDLLRWYFSEYSGSPQRPERGDPILALRGLGKDLWADEAPDVYVRRLREGWG